MASLFCGTSGFAYPTWKPDFYPEKLPAKKFLAHYATRLNAVEINYTFRRLPSRTTLESWIADTPPQFTFVVKAHQRLTHVQRLEPDDFTGVFFQALEPLRTEGRLGAVLFQLPPHLPCDVGRLEEFLAVTPAGVRCAFEFRHASWFRDEVYEALARRRAALCLAESEKLVVPDRVTSDFVYFRLRKSEYTPEDRAEIGRRTAQLLGEDKDVYVFFKHEDTPAGALYAEELLRQSR